MRGYSQTAGHEFRAAHSLTSQTGNKHALADSPNSVSIARSITLEVIRSARDHCFEVDSTVAPPTGGLLHKHLSGTSSFATYAHPKFDEQGKCL